MKHTKEPWILSEDIFLNQDNVVVYPIDQSYTDVFQTKALADVYGDKGTANRIVDCVNALAGIKNPKGFVKRMAKLEQSLNAMTQLCQLKYGNLDKDVWAEIQKAKSLLS